MRLSLTPKSQFEHGHVNSYVIDLPTGAKALLSIAPGMGWDLVIVRAGTDVVERGLFATPYDALMVLEAEYSPQPLSEGASSPGSDTPASPLARRRTFP